MRHQLAIQPFKAMRQLFVRVQLQAGFYNSPAGLLNRPSDGMITGLAAGQ